MVAHKAYLIFILAIIASATGCGHNPASEHEDSKRPTYPGVKSISYRAHSWKTSATQDLFLTKNDETHIENSHEAQFMSLVGDGSLNLLSLKLEAKDISYFRGRLKCPDRCTIITETPVEQFKMNLDGDFDVILVNN